MIEKLYNEACAIDSCLTMLSFRIDAVDSTTIEQLEEDLAHMIIRQVNLELECLKNNAA